MLSRSIHRKLIFFIIIPVLVIYGIIAALQTRWGLQTALENAQRQLSCITDLNATECDVILARAAEAAQGIAQYTVVRKAGAAEKDEITQYIRQTLEKHSDIVGSTVAFAPGFLPEHPKGFSPYLYRDPQGQIQYKDLTEEYDFLDWDWYAKPAKTGKASWSEPYNDEFGGDVLMCTYSVPFFFDGKFAGVATVDISLDEIREILERLAMNKADYYLFSAKGTVISSPTDSIVKLQETLFSMAKRHNDKAIQHVAEDIVAGNAGTISYINKFTGKRVWLVYSPLDETGWSLLACIPESEVTKPVYRKLFSVIAAFGVGLALLAGIIFSVAQRITAPLKKLSAFAKELAVGNLDAKTDGITSEDEIGQLARTFDKMVVDLKDNVEQRIFEESARKTVEGELLVARRIQSSLLPNIFPPFPDRMEFELYALNEAAKFMAGDFYDFFFIEKDVLVLVMADVSDKGVPAAMFMAVSRTAIRNFSFAEVSPAETMTKLNATLAKENVDDMFVTLFYSHYNLKTGILTYVNGGHDPPYILRSDGSVETLKNTGPLVAAFDGITYKEQTARLDKGDLIVMFTDGVTEAHKTCDDQVQLYGTDRLVELLQRIREHPVEELCHEIVDDALRFSEGARHDDITILALRQNADVTP